MEFFYHDQSKDLREHIKEFNMGKLNNIPCNPILLEAKLVQLTVVKNPNTLMV